MGPLVCRWIERFCVHGEGDHLGRPFVLDKWQKRFVYRLFEYDPTSGRRLVRRALLGLPKGCGKTELVAAICLARLAGPTSLDESGRPTVPLSPNIPVAAASYEQADRLYGAARTMVDEGPLSQIIETFDTEMFLRHEAGKMFRVAAVAGTNDGGLPTTFAADELHEWEGRRERVHLVIGNSLAKRADGLELDLSTAGADPDSLLGRLHAYGCRVQSGEVTDSGFLFEWHEGPSDVDLDDPDALRAAIRSCTPASWLDIDRIAARYEQDGIPPWEFRRYHLNQFAAAPDVWLPDGAWDACRHPEGAGAPPDGTEVVLAFDGSYGGDSTALVGVTVADVPHVFVVGVWERPEGAKDWTVPRESVLARVAEAMARWRVVEFACDPFWWERELDDWVDTYGEVVEAYPTNVPARMGPACTKAYVAVSEGRVTHDGDPQMARHLANCRTKETRQGVVIVKDRKDSPRKIDLGVAMVIGFDRATWRREQSPALLANVW